MKTSQLLVFCAVVEQGGFNRAARHLFITQPAVSMRIRELERTFGQPLLHREHDRIQLTALGQAVYPLACDIRTKYEALYRLREEFQHVESKTVTVALSNPVCAHLVTSGLLAYQSHHPEVYLIVEHMEPEHVVSALLTQQADLGILLETDYDERLAVATQWPDDLIVVQTSDKASPSVHEHAPFILPPRLSSQRRMIDQIFLRTFGHPPVGAMELDDVEGLRQAIVGSRQPAIVLHSSMAQDIATGRVRPVPLAGFPHTLSHRLCCLGLPSPSIPVQSLIQFLQTRPEPVSTS